MKFIDLSKYNTVSDWNKVDVTVDYVMIRIGYRGYGSGKVVIDPKAEEFIKACVARKIPFGLYFMSQAINLPEAEEEAKFACSYAKQYGATLPIAIDCEDGDGKATVVRADALSKAARTNIAVKFCEVVKSLGFVPAVYSSTSWFISKLDVNQLLPYKIWCAQYNTKCTAAHRVDAWQYTSYGSIEGIEGRVDISEDYSFLPKAKAPRVNVYPAPTRLLKLTSPYMKGEDVKWLQFELGMADKDIDGVFGPATNKAYKLYLGM